MANYPQKRRVPPMTASQRLLYERKQRELKIKQIRRRRTQLMIMRFAFLLFTAVICFFIIFLVMKFIDYTKSTENDYEEDIPEVTDDIFGEVSNESNHAGIDFSQLVDPSSLRPDEIIDFTYKQDEVLPKVYEYSNTFYSTFSSDNPVLGSNIETKVIVIDAGHQVDTRTANVWLSPYIDPNLSSSWVKNSLLTIGATGVSTKKPEYETTHEIADLLKTALEKIGYKVILSHPDITEKLSGSERSEVANKNNADLMISLHCDSYIEDKTVSGALALTPDIWEGYPSERLSYLSEKAATVILDEYTKATGLKNRGLKPIIKSSMFAFCKVPILLLEMGFSSNPSDDKNMNDPVFREKMVEGIVAGVNKYFSLIELGKQ